jgi:hypothetical protein|tara:strand:+ start:4327 stop:4929 length:603 start_codon:yes stop_codon:yes gene_type:complete
VAEEDKMANAFQDFLKGNIKDVIIGLAVGIIITLLGDFTLEQGLVIITLSPLVALILNQLFQTFVPNQKNQRTALIILALIGGFFLVQEFQLGTFSVENAQSAVEPQGIFKTVTAPISKLALGKTGFFGTIGAISGLAFFVNPIVGLIVLAGLALFIGLPFLGLSVAIFQNFQLLLIIGGFIALAFILFKNRQIKSIRRA